MGLDDYNALMETVYLFSHPGTAREIEEGLETPWEECVPESEVSL
jgi:PHD/YefM family antitoxin component YafN of YafNO toxin-antitoxin module